MEDFKREACSTPAESEYPAHIRERAADILRNGNPCQFYMDTWGKNYATIEGDYSLGCTLLLTVFCTLNRMAHGYNTNLTGIPGIGKSYAVYCMFELFPEWKTKTISASDKSLYYMGLSEGTCIYIDDMDDEQTGLMNTIKKATSYFKKGSVHQANGKEHPIPPYVTFISSCVNNFIDAQLKRRFRCRYVEDSEERLRAIQEKQKERASQAESEEPDEDILVCRCMYEIIAAFLIDNKVSKTLIPFSKEIMGIDYTKTNAWNTFEDMITCFTVINCFQREIVNGQLLSTVADFDAARELYQKTAEANEAQLDEVQQEILNFVSAQQEPITRKPIHAHMKQLPFNIGYQVVNRALEGILHTAPHILHEVRKQKPTGGSPQCFYSYREPDFGQNISLNKEAAEMAIARWKGNPNQVETPASKTQKKGKKQKGGTEIKTKKGSKYDKYKPQILEYLKDKSSFLFDIIVGIGLDRNSRSIQMGIFRQLQELVEIKLVTVSGEPRSQIYRLNGEIHGVNEISDVTTVVETNPDEVVESK